MGQGTESLGSQVKALLEGRFELLVGLQAAARNPAEAPHGLWLLCPGDSAAGTPQLDGHIVDVVDSTQRLALDGDFLDGLRTSAA